MQEIKLTQYSHGAGCGCKIAPSVLDQILEGVGRAGNAFPKLLVGNEEKDDAAVMDLGDGTAIISTTDFFMPIVDEPELFGRIAATNAISDIYAMGGKPILAVAILGWPVDMLPAEVAGRVVHGARLVCEEAGIPLAGGHSIDAPEPIFGLAVTGRVDIKHLKRNKGAQPGDLIFLTKPLGIGILTTALKQAMLKPEHSDLASDVMIRLNDAGSRLGTIVGVHAMTDVTGFGLAGHLFEMCEASGTSAVIEFNKLPLIDESVMKYISWGCVPGGTKRNFESYQDSLKMDSSDYINLICDPQTSGGLLIAVDPNAAEEVSAFLQGQKLCWEPVGQMTSRKDFTIWFQ